MNSTISLASLKSSPELSAGSGLQMRTQTNTANDAFGQMLESAVSRPSERNFTQGKADRTQASRGDHVQEHREFDDRASRARGRTRNNKAEREDSLAGACAVTAQPTPLDNAPPARAAAEEGPPVGFKGTTTTSDTAVESNSSVGVEDGSKIANGQALTETTSALAEMLTPTPEEPAQVELQQATTPTSNTTPTALPVETDVATARTDVALTDVPAQTISTQSALQADLQSQTSDRLSADDALTNSVLPTTTGEVSPEPDDTRHTARAARRAWNEALESPRGIATAQMSQAMKTTTKKDETAGLAEHFLPGSTSIPVPPLPKLAPDSSRTVTVEISADDIAAAKLSPSPVRADVSQTLPTEMRPLAPMGRISDIISREVRMFKRAADDLVEVVLTPDAKTQISLRLQWRDGQMEAQARCDLGDYKALNTQWPQLQAALASQGVRLSHLSERVQSGFTDFFSNSNFAQSQDGDRQPSKPPTALENGTVSPDLKTTKPVATRNARYVRRLLESWA